MQRRPLTRRWLLAALASGLVGLTRIPTLARDEGNDSQVRQTRKRRPSPTVTPTPPPPVTDDIITVNTSTSAGTNLYEPGVNLVKASADQFRMADPTNAIIRMGQTTSWACIPVQYFTTQQLWVDSTAPPDPAVANGQPPWTRLDNFIGKAQAAGLGTNIVLSFLAAEFMLPNGVDGSDGWVDVDRAFPATAHFADYAEMFRRCAVRYGTSVKYMMHNEFKGLWGGAQGLPTYNRWRYEDMTTMYNLAWDAVKGVSPLCQMGGPYKGFTSGGGTNKGSVAAKNQILWAADPTMPKADGAPADAGNVDSRDLDAVNYWLTHCKGYDFFVLDSGNVHGIEYMNWIRNVAGITKPVYWAEFYPGSGINITGLTTTEARKKETAQLCENMRRIAISGGNGAWNWGPEEGSSLTTKAAAISNAHWASTNAATEMLAGTYGRYFKTYFPKNTPLVQVTSTNPFITAMASATKLLIINRLSVDTDVTVIVNSGTPTITTVPAFTAIVRDIP